MATPQPKPAASTRSLPIVAIVLIVGGALFLLMKVADWTGQQSRGTNHPVVGQPLSMLRLEPLTGTDQPIGPQELIGKISLINFWGTWCPPCRREFPHIAGIHQRLATEPRFQLLSIACPASGDQSLESLQQETLDHLADYQVSFPTYRQGGDMEMSLVMLLQSPGLGIPMTFVVDQQGRIRGFWDGYSSGDEIDMERLIRTLLAEPAASAEKP